MLKAIPVAQLRVGMHLHKLDGSWLSHPFWKSRFVITTEAELVQVRGCGVASCWIDTARGLDVAAPAAVVVMAATAAIEPVSVAAASRELAAGVGTGVGTPAAVVLPPPRPQPASMADELKKAAAICQRGRAAVTAMFNEARMGRTLDAENCLPLVEDITASVLRNPGALVSLARLKTADDYSYMHSVAVCALMVALAQRLGWPDDELRHAGLAGLMHDIGKAVMPTEVLNKPGKLTEAEFSVMRSHPERGHAILVEGNGVTPQVLEVALHHHERIDGTGYPHRLGAERIGAYARAGAICDVYDAITSNRPYKAGWDPAESVERMSGWKGHFDPAMFSAFVQSLGIYPTGSLVRLESKRLAVVLEQNLHALVAPQVKVFYSLRSQMPIEPTVLDLSRPGCSDRIAGRQDRKEGAAGEFARVDDLWLDPELLRRSRRKG
ncbi:MAG: HD-GYP domain-containing protein [Pseudomonadota bacterium]|nr:HD-GYP domain-containing protein [Pseudomonadota bacterium]